MRLILTRHGETIENKLGVTQGHLPGKLSPEGLRQAQKLALRLKDEKLDAIYTSDLARAAETALVIGGYHHSVPMHFIHELREINLGSITGMSKKSIDWKHLPPDVETRQSLLARAEKAINLAYKEHQHGTVLFVGHNRINKAIITVILRESPAYIDKMEHMLNTSVSIFEIQEDKSHVIHLLNCTRHLEGGNRRKGR